ncbi:MAG: peptide MFS transporter, partial [Steroidobacteraceae bacterium]
MQTSVENLTVTRSSRLPRNAWRLIILEFWERFSYYGILAIMVLFLTGERTNGGFGWSDSRALNALAIFSALAFMLPTLGGYIADRWIGARRSVLLGSTLLVAGNVLLTVSAVGLAAASAAAAQSRDEALLIAGLAAVALGNCFFKSPMVTLLGNIFGREDATRDQAFRYYYQAIMLGTLAAALLVGSLVKFAGWWSGFALTAVGMSIAFAMFLGMPRVDSAAQGTIEQSAPTRSAATATDFRQALLSILLLGAFLCIIMVGWIQFQGLWILEVERSSDRSVGDWTVPSSWLLAVNAIAVVTMAPAVGRWWQRLRPPEQPLGFALQFATAFFVMGVGHLVIAFGFRNPSPHAVSMFWPIASVLIVTLGEAIFWPSSYNAVHKLSPVGMKSVMMGLWFAMLGIGHYFTHQVARLAESVGFAR